MPTLTIPRIVYTDLSNFSISGNNSTTGNLLNYFTDSLWISSNADDQELRITFTTSGVTDAFVLDPFNNSFGPSAILTLSASDNSTFTAGLVSPISAFSLYQSAGIESGMLIVPFTSVTKKYWKVILTGMNTSPSAGNMWIGKTLDFTSAYDFGYQKEDAEYVTTEFTALNGKTRSSQNYDGRKIYNIKFSLQNNTFRTAYQTFISTIKGRLRPFYFVDVDTILTITGNSNYYSSGNIRYMHLDSDYSPITVQRYGLNNTEQLRLKTKYSIY